MSEQTPCVECGEAAGHLLDCRAAHSEESATLRARVKELEAKVRLLEACDEP